MERQLLQEQAAVDAQLASGPAPRRTRPTRRRRSARRDFDATYSIDPQRGLQIHDVRMGTERYAQSGGRWDKVAEYPRAVADRMPRGVREVSPRAGSQRVQRRPPRAVGGTHRPRPDGTRPRSGLGGVAPQVATLARARQLSASLSLQAANARPGDVAAKVAAAEEMARVGLSLFGVDLPPVHWAPGSDAAHATRQRITIGLNFARSVDVHALTQVLMHEAGHVLEGHVGVVGQLVQGLYQAGAIDRSTYEALNHSDELSADVYSAVGAWLFDPDPHVPASARWHVDNDDAPSPTHPSSQNRAVLLTALYNGLNAATAYVLAAGIGDAAGGSTSMSSPAWGRWSMPPAI